MTQEERNNIIKELNTETFKIIQSKSQDYAGTDVLKNFKQMQQMLIFLEVSMHKIEGVHMFYILLKIQRICNLIFNNKSPNNESLTDSIIDLRNYLDLLLCTIKEEEIEREKDWKPF